MPLHANNIIVAGTNYSDMAYAVNKILEMQGGITAVLDGKCLERVPLPVAGLLTDEMDIHQLSGKLKSLNTDIAEILGCKISTPFRRLAFLTLTTSPKWKLTDQGLIDISSYSVIPSVKP